MTVSSPALSFATALVRSWRTREKSKRPCWTFAYRARRPLSSGITCQHAPRRPSARADARRRLPSPRPGAVDRGDSLLVDGAVVPAAERGKFRERGGAFIRPVTEVMSLAEASPHSASASARNVDGGCDREGHGGAGEEKPAEDRNRGAGRGTRRRGSRRELSLGQHVAERGELAVLPSLATARMQRLHAQVYGHGIECDVGNAVAVCIERGRQGAEREGEVRLAHRRSVDPIAGAEVKVARDVCDPIAVGVVASDDV